MAKPSIGDAVTVASSGEQENEIKELTVLEHGSKESIFHMIFEEENKGEVKQDE